MPIAPSPPFRPSFADDAEITAFAETLARFEPFRALVLADLARIRCEGVPFLAFDPERPEVEGPVAGPRPPGSGVASAAPGDLEAFIASNVRAQRQAGFSSVLVSLPQGDATAAGLERLASLAEALGDGSIRTTGQGHVLVEPHFVVLLGGGVGPPGTSFGRPAAKLPARLVPSAVARLVGLYLSERAVGEDAGSFFGRAFERARRILSSPSDATDSATTWRRRPERAARSRGASDPMPTFAPGSRALCKDSRSVAIPPPP